jgi:hypothetical protein
MPSEIDDIFSGVASTSASAVAAVDSKQKKKSSSKKRKAEKTVVDSNAIEQSNSSSLRAGKPSKEKDIKASKKAETILDPSKVIEAKIETKKLEPLKKKKKLTEAEEDFMDTRGKNSECF